MKVKLMLIFTCLFYFGLSFTTAHAIKILDSPIAQEKLEIEVNVLLNQEKYDELEKMADNFRTTKAKNIGGGWELAMFYNAININGKNEVQVNEYINKLEKWMKKYPDSVTAKVASAYVWVYFAWRARGRGYANTVTEQGWKLMNKRIERAYQLVKNKPLKSANDCPGRYSVLMKIAKAQSWNKFERNSLFQEAISFEPGYHVYYLQRAEDLMPRWFGEEGEWQHFAENAIKLTPKTEGMGIYARILRFMWEYNEFKDFKDPRISWPKMKQGFIDMDRSYPNSPYNLNYYCMFACIAEEKETARKLFERIDNKPYINVWKGRANFERWRRWARTE